MKALELQEWPFPGAQSLGPSAQTLSSFSVQGWHFKNPRQDLGLKEPEVSLAGVSRSVLHPLSNPVCTEEAVPAMQL